DRVRRSRWSLRTGETRRGLGTDSTPVSASSDVGWTEVPAGPGLPAALWRHRPRYSGDVDACPLDRTLAQPSAAGGDGSMRVLHLCDPLLSVRCAVSLQSAPRVGVATVFPRLVSGHRSGRGSLAASKRRPLADCRSPVDRELSSAAHDRRVDLMDRNNCRSDLLGPEPSTREPEPEHLCTRAPVHPRT